MKTIKILSLTLIMSIFYTGMSFAHQQDQRGQRGKTTSEERASKRIERMKESLNLTPDQVTKLQAIQTQSAKDREQARKDNRQDMKSKMEAYDVQVKSILTPEQYQKYQDQRKDMRKGGDKHGKWNKDNKEGNQQGKCNKEGNNRQGKWDKKKSNSQKQG